MGKDTKATDLSRRVTVIQTTDDSRVCTVEIRSGMDSTDGARKAGKSCCLSSVSLFVYLIVVILITLGHEAAMLYIQHQIQRSAGLAVYPWILYYAIPSVVPLFVGAVAVLVCTHMQCWSTTISKPWNCKFFLITAFMFGLMHTAQVILFLFVNTRLYLDVVPKTPTCSCTGSVPQICDCYIPKHGKQIVLTRYLQASNPILDLQSISPEQTTTPSLSDFVAMHVAKDPVGLSEFRNILGFLKLMLILLQCSVLVGVLRFPLWIMYNNLQVNMDFDRKFKTSSRRALHDSFQDGGLEAEEEVGGTDMRVTIVSSVSVMSNGTSQCSRPYSVAFTDAVAAVMRNLRLEKDRDHKHWLLRNKTEGHKWTGYAYAIEMCYYCFIETVDAFALLDNIVENVDHFVNKPVLTYSTLFFISLSLFVGTAANFLVSHPFRSHTVNRLGKAIVVASNNVPLLILRCYMFYMLSGFKDQRVGSIFLLFTMKELVIVILAIIEIVVFLKTPKHT